MAILAWIALREFLLYPLLVIINTSGLQFPFSAAVLPQLSFFLPRRLNKYCKQIREEGPKTFYQLITNIIFCMLWSLWAYGDVYQLLPKGKEV